MPWASVSPLVPSLQGVDPYPETCDIDYQDIKCVMVSVHSPRNGNAHLQADMQADVQCKQFPPALGPELADRAQEQARRDGSNVCWFKLGMLLTKQECARLVEVLQAQVGWGLVRVKQLA